MCILSLFAALAPIGACSAEGEPASSRGTGPGGAGAGGGASGTGSGVSGGGGGVGGGGSGGSGGSVGADAALDSANAQQDAAETDSAADAPIDPSCLDGGQIGSDASDGGSAEGAAGADGEAGARDGITISGTLVGVTVPASANVYVLWQVTGPNPDHLYVYGQGSSNGSTFSVTIPARPPASPLAVNGSGIGVGFVVLFPAGYTLAEGQPPSTIDNDLIGVARQAVIFRETGQACFGWMATFPPGYACGECFQGSPFDGFTPRSCAGLVIYVGSGGQVCNWT